MSRNGHIVSAYNPKTVQHKYKKVRNMECPYLSVTPNRKICTLMDKKGLDGELEAFDLKHFCMGNPNHCYFHRLYAVQKPTKEQLAEHKPKKVQVTFFTELSNPKLGETEISVDPNEDNSLHFKLVKEGLDTG